MSKIVVIIPSGSVNEVFSQTFSLRVHIKNLFLFMSVRPFFFISTGLIMTVIDLYNYKIII